VQIWPIAKPAVLTAITILDEAFDQYAFVSAKYPGSNRPERFVKVSRTGGGLDNIATDTARLLVECFARDIGQAESMAATAASALRNAGGTTVVTTQGPIFVRRFDNDSFVSDFGHPEILDYERSLLTGDLMVKAN
jgi:hypothetical protein